MRILVTGHRGFVGSNVAAHLLAEGHEVVGYDDGSSGVDFASKSIAATALFFDMHMPPTEHVDATVHCAAYADIRDNQKSFDNRHRIFESNVELTFDLLDWCGLAAKPFIFMSTCAVYGPGTDVKTETSPTHATSPYAASKIAAEAYVQACAKAHTIFRLGCVVGKNYHHGHIADFVRQVKETGRIAPLSDGLGQKACVHVREVCSAVSQALVGRLQGTYNLAFQPWCPRDTAALMGLEGTKWPANKEGWPGDNFTQVSSMKYITAAGDKTGFDVHAGVAEALISLGWDPERLAFK